jgi:murein DD-endopeptidase MepM/ murein hydrolase activator NlpD
MTMSKRKKKQRWYDKLRVAYRLVVFDEQTFEDRFTFRLTWLNILVSLLSISTVMIFFTFFLIAYTPIREYIPGYPSIDQRKELYKLNMIADSLTNSIRQRDLYLQNIKNIIEDNEELYRQPEPEDISVRYDSVYLSRSEQDSILRAEFEAQEMYNLYFTESAAFNESSRSSIRNFNFFRPLNGVITSRFDLSEKHYGIDIVTTNNEAVMATLEGTVIYSGWTIETGHVIALQHLQNLISIYKHNSILLKAEGDLAKAGEPIAIAGQSGELTTGPHLHFELWYNGTPMDPEEYIIFN